MHMFKLMRRLLFLIVIILVLAFGGMLIFLNSVEVNITEDDLPESVYDASGDLATMIQDNMIAIVTSDEEDTYTLFEDFLNLMIFKTIRDEINPDYDPLNGDADESGYIIRHTQFTLDYIIAEMTEDDQVRLAVSMKRSTFPQTTTAFHFYFDTDLTLRSMTFSLSLDRVLWDDKEISRNVYDRVVSMADKDQIEEQIDTGTLDLDAYTYEVSFADVLPDWFPSQ